MTNFYKLSLLFVLTLISMGVWAQNPVFVNHAATGVVKDGTTWETAYTDLKAAIDATTAGEIWVAAGKYLPTSDPTDREATFQLKDGVAIYGGFAGVETDRSARNWETNVTILSGDIDGNDAAEIITAPESQINGGNSYNVVVGSGTDATAILDGFTITGGFSNEEGSFGTAARQRNGAGIYNHTNGNPTLRNLVVTGNLAHRNAGGVYNNSSSPTITNVVISNNVALTNMGAGMTNLSNSNPTLEDVEIISNKAQGRGGAMYNETNSSPSLTNVSIRGNQATGHGGGIYNTASTPTLINVAITGNVSGGNGGGLYTTDGGSDLVRNPTLINCIVSGNHSVGNSGGIFQGNLNNWSRVILHNTIVWGNNSEASDNNIRNSIHASSSANNLIDVTGSNATANHSGANIAGIPSGLTAADIFENPTAPSATPNAGGDYSLKSGSFAIDKGDNDLYTNAGGNLAGTDLTGTGDRLVGDNIDLGPYEYQDAATGGITPDANGILYVKKDAAGNGSGNNWTNALNELSDALIAADNAALGIQQIWVAKGTYHPQENLQTPGSIYDGTDNTIMRYRTFILREGVKVYGGFEGVETTLEQRQWEADGITLTHQSILSGDFGGNDVVDPLDPYGAIESISGNDENALHVVVSWDNSPSTVLDGFTISGGNASLTSSPITPPGTEFIFARSAGAGIFVNGSSPTLHNLIVEHNRSAATGSNPAGAGIHILNGKSNEDINIANVTVKENIGAARGAGIYIVGATVKIENSRFTGNKTTGQDGGAAYIGAGVAVDFENPVFINNVASSGSAGAMATIASGTNPSTITINNGTFTANKALGDGTDAGAIRVSTAITVNITNSVFSQNTSVRRGGAIYSLASGKTNIVNSTFSENKATEASGSGGAIYFYGGTAGHEANLRNMVFYGNEATVNGGALTFGNAFNNATITNSTFYENKTTATSGTGGAIRVVSGNVKLYNSIFYGNTAFTGDDISNNSTLDVKNAITQAYSTTDDATNNIQVGENPLFASANPNDQDDFLRLLAGSPAIDEGSDQAYIDAGGDLLDLDLADNPRFSGNAIDLGAFEYFEAPTTITPGPGGILYVKHDASGTGLGYNWENALTDLSEALQAADDASLGIQQIWVAAGTYLPTENLGSTTDDRDKAFILREGVKVYGGFAGTESAGFDLSTRDFVANETVLSGDFDGDDIVSIVEGTVTDIANNTDNAYHVVVSYDNSPATVLDGFTVSGGSASGSGAVSAVSGFDIDRSNGAGIYVRKGNPTLNHLVVQNNYTSAATGILGSGTGIYLHGGRGNAVGAPAEPMTVADITIKHNYGSNNIGGANFNGSLGAGIFLNGEEGHSIALLMSGGTIDGNQAALGGAVHIRTHADVTFKKVTFSNNKARRGGAIYTRWEAAIETNINVTIEDSRFVGNTASETSNNPRGGGIYAHDNSAFVIRNTLFDGNSAPGSYGGALTSAVASAHFVIDRSTFTGSISNAGGAIYFGSANQPRVITNSVFYDNSSSNHGGAITLGGGAATIVNSVLYNNHADGQGGALRITNSSSNVVNLHNNIIYGNTAYTAAEADFSIGGGSANITISNTITQLENQYLTGNDVRVGMDPQFLSTDESSTEFLWLSSTSPAVNAGDNQRYIDAGGDLDNDLDLAGNPRLFDTNIDLGAYEYQEATTPTPVGDVIFVDHSATAGGNNGTSWEDAFTDLQAALSAATADNQIWVAKGVYKPVSPVNPASVTEPERMTTFQLINNVAVYGGFAGTEDPATFDLDTRDFTTNRTILSGDIDGNDQQTVITDPTTQVVGANSRNVVVGSGTNNTAILDGFTITAGYSIEEIGSNSSRERNGAGIYNLAGSPTLRNLVISGNLSHRNAGGIYNNSGSSPEITNVEISHNVAHTNIGAGITILSNSHPVLRDVKITHNTSQSNGGGIYIETNSSADLTDTEVSYNTAQGTTGGGGLYVSTSSSVSIAGSEFIGNSTNGYGGAIVKVQSGTITSISYSKFVDNTSTLGGGALHINYGNGGTAGGNPVPISQSLFANNRTNANGGAISLLNSGVTTLNGVTIYGNQAGGDGGAVNAGGSTGRRIDIHNSILYGNTSGSTSGTHDVTGSASVTFDIKHSITQVAGTNGENGVQVGVDPQFLSTNPNELEFLWLATNSPAVNTGDNSLYVGGNINTDLDLAGNPRLNGALIDLGPYEATPRATPTLEVRWNGNTISPNGLQLTSGQQGVLTVVTNSDATVNITADALLELSSSTSPSDVTAVANGTGQITVTLPGTLAFAGASMTIDVQVGSIVPTLEVRWNGTAIPASGLQITLGEQGRLTVVTNSDAVPEISADALLELSSGTTPSNATAVAAGSGLITVTLRQTAFFEEVVLNVNVQVNKMPQQIRLYAPQGVMLSDGRLQLTEASASSGLPVTLTVDDASIATISGMELTLHKRGTVRVTATQAGDDTYAPAEPVTVEIVVISHEDAGLRVHPALSPNGDGINDFLRIDGIEAYPQNTLIIFDYAGHIIAEIKDYDNQQNVFTGDQLRDGTYFYRLNYRANSGRWHTLKGFFELKKN